MLNLYYCGDTHTSTVTLLHCKKGYRFSRPQAGCHWPNFPWPGIVKFFPARESLVSDIPALGTGKSINFFYSVPPSSNMPSTSIRWLTESWTDNFGTWLLASPCVFISCNGGFLTLLAVSSGISSITTTFLAISSWNQHNISCWC